MSASSAFIFRTVALFLCVCVYFGRAQECSRKHETVLELKDIFIGRCVDYQTTVHPEHFCSSGLRDCHDLWTKFSSPFLNNPPCNVTADLYTDFIAAAHHPITGKQLFYSGLWGFVQRYSNQGQRYTIQEDTLIDLLIEVYNENLLRADGIKVDVLAALTLCLLLRAIMTAFAISLEPDQTPSYLLSDTSFCGGDAGDDSTVACERWNPETCPHTASGDFWVAASKNFARNAVGNVYVLLNATRDPVYKSTSYFNKYEVPEMMTGVVRKVTALLINDSPSTKREPCDNDESLQILRKTLQEKSIEFDCKENQRDLVYLFCMDNAHSEICTVNVQAPVDQAPGNLGNFVLISSLLFVYTFLRK